MKVELSRRSFLKMIGLAGVALAVPTGAIDQLAKNVEYLIGAKKFNPRVQYRHAVSFGMGYVKRYDMKKVRADCRLLLTQHYRSWIPRRYWSRIDFMETTDDFGDQFMMAYRYKPI